MNGAKPAAVAAPSQPNYPELKCQIERSGPGATQPLTVGERFGLICDGPIAKTLKPNLHLSFLSPDEQYSMAILGIKDQSAGHLSLIVTSYKPGENKNKSINITDGESTYKANDLSWTVSSILKPDAPPPKPFPSEGPFFLSYPLWLWFSIAGFILALSAVIGFIFWRRKKRQKLMAELDKYATMLPAFSQFSKDMRQVMRKISSLKPDENALEMARKIEEDFRLYLIRELRVPALQVSNREILKEIKRGYRPIFEDYQTELRRLLFEFERSSQGTSKVKPKDCEQLSFLSRQVAEHIYGVRRKSK